MKKKPQSTAPLKYWQKAAWIKIHGHRNDPDHCKTCGHRYSSKVHKTTCAARMGKLPPAARVPPPSVAAPPPGAFEQPAQQPPATMPAVRDVGPWPQPGVPLYPPTPPSAAPAAPAPEAPPAQPPAPPLPPPTPLNLRFGSLWKYVDRLDPEHPLTPEDIRQLDEATTVLPISVAPPVKTIIVPWYVGSALKAAPILVPRAIVALRRQADKMRKEGEARKKAKEAPTSPPVPTPPPATP